MTTANVRPYLALLLDDDPHPPEAIRFRSALRRNILEATQAVTPVPGAANIPAALVRTFSAIAALDALKGKVDANHVASIRHDLFRILDHITGNDHSGCSTAPSVVDYGRVEAPTVIPIRACPIQADIDAVRAALREAEACTDLDDHDGMTHVRALRDSLDGLLAEQRRGA